MLDRFPKIVVHAILLLVPPLLTWLAQDYVPALQATDPHRAAMVTSLVAMATLVFTTATRSYGVGQAKPIDPVAAAAVAVRGSDPTS